MPPGLTSTTAAKETKVKLKRMDPFRNDQDGRPKDPRPYPNTEMWRRAMGERLKYKAAELRENFKGCLIALRYDIHPIQMATVISHPVRFAKGPENCWCSR